MWNFFGELMPPEVWTWVGALVLLPVTSWLSYRFGRRSHTAQTQRNVLEELQEMLLKIRDLSSQPRGDDDGEGLGGWLNERRQMVRRVELLRNRVSKKKLRARLGDLDLLLRDDALAHYGTIERALGFSERQVRQVLTREAIRAVEACLRGDPLPSRSSEAKEMADVEQAYCEYLIKVIRPIGGMLTRLAQEISDRELAPLERYRRSFDRHLAEMQERTHETLRFEDLEEEGTWILGNADKVPQAHPRATKQNAASAD
ncbi:hypothetical protein LO763_22070 [Glycomyces sp. A-F 0318]|uniref:hypothetical protein n=1 Tax=Glycomyces amatae TaxID=2881355 RepID=UPI001E551035|nr:hypothetical protein [Glycomyces amatae]MCD0446304.1 hypothetical protein [Glycomyces amatae]